MCSIASLYLSLAHTAALDKNKTHNYGLDERSLIKICPNIMAGSIRFARVTTSAEISLAIELKWR